MRRVPGGSYGGGRVLMGEVPLRRPPRGGLVLDWVRTPCGKLQVKTIGAIASHQLWSIGAVALPQRLWVALGCVPLLYYPGVCDRMGVQSIPSLCERDVGNAEVTRR